MMNKETKIITLLIGILFVILCIFTYFNAITTSKLLKEINNNQIILSSNQVLISNTQEEILSLQKELNNSQDNIIYQLEELEIINQ